MLRFHLIYVLAYCLAWSSSSRGATALSCKDENNNDVDWFINMKLPKIGTEDKDSNLAKGKSYAYLVPGADTKWTLSSLPIDNIKSMLGRTWKEFSNNKAKNGATYLMYNDDISHQRGTVGHLKGFLAFDGKSGFWVSHSVPRFGDRNMYDFPKSAQTNGQTALCVTFGVSQLNQIIKHLLYCHPNIYVKKVTSEVGITLDKNSMTIFENSTKFIRKPPYLYEAKLKSLGGLDIRTFAKDNQQTEDIYSEVIAPKLGTSLVAETWRRGAGVNLESACDKKHTVVDVVSIKMTALDSGRDREVAFKSTEDHSKWAVSPEVENKWVCIGDLNRMESQKKRGGGALCFQSKNVWGAFQGIIQNTTLCHV